MPPEVAALAALFLVAAALYGSVGFGGGTAYLALLTLAGLPLPTVAVLALVCNVIVVTGGAWHFVRAGHFRPRLAVPFLVASIPAAYLGGRWPIGVGELRVVMGLALALAAVAMVASERVRGGEGGGRRPPWPLAGGLGMGIGGLSGLVGIGGGVFLAPVLHLLRWGTAQEIAALASVFILVNSLAGLAGKAVWVGEVGGLAPYALLFVAVFVGGQVGSRWGARRLPGAVVRRVTAVVVLVAAVNLLVGL